MATLDSSEANIHDVETINWQYIVYPLLVVVVLVVGGIGYYYSLVQQRDTSEQAARAALVLAKTPEELIKIADQYPGTDNATLALLTAAEESFTKLDFTSASKDYQRIIDSGSSTPPQLRQSAQLGQGSVLEATGKLVEATASYLTVARLSGQSPYAPYAYYTAARIYDQLGDKETERKILGEAVGLDADSPFVKQAKSKLKELNATATLPAAPTPVTAVNAAPAVKAPVAAPAVTNASLAPAHP